MVLRFIADRYQAKSLLHLPPHVAKEIMKRPGDFIQAAKRHCEPELNFKPRMNTDGHGFFNAEARSTKRVPIMHLLFWRSNWRK
jgi:hypothetical protein